MLKFSEASNNSFAFETDFAEAFPTAAAPASPKEADLLGLNTESTPDPLAQPAPSRGPLSNFDILSGVEAPPTSVHNKSEPPQRDLLGGSPNSFDPFASLTSERMQPSQEQQPTKPASQTDRNDLFSSFSSFDPFASNPPKTTAVPQVSQQPKTEPDLFDPFKTVPTNSAGKSNAEANLMGGWATTTSAPKPAQTSHIQNTTSFDPFADLASFTKPAQQQKTLSGQNITPSKPAPTTQQAPSSFSQAPQARQTKPNYSVNFNPNQQNWKASKKIHI